MWICILYIFSCYRQREEINYHSNFKSFQKIIDLWSKNMQYFIIHSKVVNDKSLHKYYNLHDILVLGPIFRSTAATAAKSLQSCLTLCDPRDGSPPGSPVPGVLQARTLEWVAISFSNAWKWKVKVKLRPTLSDLMDCSLPGSSVHGIFQATVLEWGTIAFSSEALDYFIQYSRFIP